MGQSEWGLTWDVMSLQVQVRRPEVLLDGLEPGRDYEISVQSLRGPESSEARGIRARTRECPNPGCPAGQVPLLVSQSSMAWGTSGPLGPSPCPTPPLLWRPRAGLEALLCSAAVLAPLKHLGFSDVSHDTARVIWEGAPRPVRLVRVTYVSSEGGHSGQVRAEPARGPSVSRDHRALRQAWGRANHQITHIKPQLPRGALGAPGVGAPGVGADAGVGAVGDQAGEAPPQPSCGSVALPSLRTSPFSQFLGGHGVILAAGAGPGSPPQQGLQAPAGWACHVSLPPIADRGSWECHLGHTGAPLFLHHLHCPCHLPLPWGWLLYTDRPGHHQ